MQGEGGALYYDTIQIGTLGAWRLSGDKTFSATGCDIAAFWVLAGVARLCARPHTNGVPKLWSVEGDVASLTAAAVALTDITLHEEGAAP